MSLELFETGPGFSWRAIMSEASGALIPARGPKDTAFLFDRFVEELS